jgi:hypothetical protein
MAQRPLVLSPSSALLATAGVVGVSTAFFPAVSGYGTVLYQVVGLSGWAILAALTSDIYADTHDIPLTLAALVVNVLVFLIPGAVIWLISRRHWPRACVAILLVWCAFYLASLFILFPATDGP